jgi:protein involved in polysaccharide export with SLBB domain
MQRPPFPKYLYLALAAAACLAPVRRACSQSILDYQNASRSSSMGMLPSFPSGAKLPSLPSGGADGMQVLQDMNVLFETVNDSDYILGPGDVLSMGLGNRIASIPVNPEGNVVIDGIGPVRVSDMPLLQAKKILTAKIASVYKGERMFVTLARAKRVQASIVGAVQAPGMYAVSAAARVTDLLQLAQGFSVNASKIVTVIGRNGGKAVFDLDRYYLGNDILHNPYVQAGDLIKIEEVDYDQSILWIRESETINAVQLKEGQSAYDAVTAYNSIKKHKFWDRIAVYEGEDQIAVFGIKEAKGFQPKPGQLLEVRSYKPTVFVGGAVMHPTFYDFNANYNALDYIASAGILSTTGNTGKIRVIGADGKERIGDTLRIAPGDHIIVPESKESRVRDYITLAASVASIVTSIVLTVITLNPKK